MPRRRAINRGADGPAALVVSELERAAVSGLKLAIERANAATTADANHTGTPQLTLSNMLNDIASWTR